MDIRTLIELSDRYLMRTYRRAPVAFRSGEGARLVGVDGRTYLDFVAGIAVCALGHNHPALTRAICAQAGRLLHVSNLYHIPEQVDLARWLVEHSVAERVFFCNSGAEAVEAAIKIARKVGRADGGRRFEVIVAERAFHGRTLGALAATGQARYRQGFEPLPAGFVSVPFNDVPALRAAVTPATCAVMLEPVQGEGGIHPATREYLAEARRLCDDHGLLLILDEVQTGMGRTGRLFAYQHFGVTPDVVTLAKGLGGGVPIGAVLARGRAAEALAPGDHGSTFGGNPLACAAALAVARTLDEEDLVGRAARVGDYLAERLRALARRHPVITDVRGLGLLVAVELATEAAPVVDACRDRGLLVNAVQPTVLRLAPPLIIGEADVDEAIEILDAALAAAAAGPKDEEGPS
ncbi:MAG: acetylornithine transaminase [Armatimonadota bacterium]|nr:acetylornithine transaminase [Armatimonadota bacterium]MDR7437111.1 acetylornithine transaminase [Armatimonadota bacterium]MDR7472456.1 acetylornithine transaminase [Armatimonadota bacterium]MDR7506639.1 acetylornithine transaminase [Armatimonadota bacterium]MDR7509197.1 acetylornithine transaminase [Armatimonadota bacterium]